MPLEITGDLEGVIESLKNKAPVLDVYVPVSKQMLDDFKAVLAQIQRENDIALRMGFEHKNHVAELIFHCPTLTNPPWVTGGIFGRRNVNKRRKQRLFDRFCRWYSNELWKAKNG